jgi:putative tryptophan/tyrosine transport system substrate-binding protein
VVNDATLTAHQQRIVDFAATHRLPAMHDGRTFVEDGGLMAYSVDFNDMLRRTAGYVHKILKGANPGDLPIEQPTKFDLVVNMRTATTLGLTIPPSILVRADQVIE